MKKDKWLIALAAGAGAAAVAYVASRKDIPAGATAVQPFDKNRYLGTWYEVARLPSIIEKNLKDVIEEYSLNNDGSLKVVTKAYNFKTDKQKEASGRIKFAGSEDVAKMKVSYLGPFYLPYNVLDIDPDYQHAMVSSGNLDYLWILSRETTIPEAIKNQFLGKAREIGFEVDKMEWM